MSRPFRTARFVAACALLATVLASCGGGGDSAAGTESSPAVSSAATTDSTRAEATVITTPSGRTTPPAPTTEAVQSQVSSQIIETPADVLAPTSRPLLDDYTPAPTDKSVVVEATVPTVHVYASATATTTDLTIENPLPSGAPLSFLVEGQTSTRYKVLLPIKPNGATGWVDPNEVAKKYSHQYKVVVELSAHKITVTNGSNVILSDTIGVGKASTPTPDGKYYIKELLRPPDPNGAYGPYAYGVSGYSPVVQNFKGGDDTIGIHGTNEPELLGKDVSHGCIRISNADITKLAKILPLGTPVVIKA